MEYKKLFESDCSEEDKIVAQAACEKLVSQFYPLFRQYSNIITGEHWAVCKSENKKPFASAEIRLFISTFVEDPFVKKELHRYNPGSKAQTEIFHRMNFIKETYGTLESEDIMTDLQMLFLKLARRYKPQGKSFCAYVNSSYGYEVSRHIKAFIKNPICIPYKKIEYEDYMRSICENKIEDSHFEDSYFYEMATGIPSPDWVQGETCSDLFADLSPTERKILVKYYIEDWNDRQIADFLGIHINTVNQKRRVAVASVAEKYGFSPEDIIRCRKSGRQAVLPLKH